MTIKDRGNIKWTSLMLVEHRERLKKLKAKEKYREKPSLSEDELQRLNYILKIALKQNKKVKLVYYHQHRFHEKKGWFKKYCCAQDQVIFIEKSEDNNEELRISLDSIINIKIISGKSSY